MHYVLSEAPLRRAVGHKKSPGWKVFGLLDRPTETPVLIVLLSRWADLWGVKHACFKGRATHGLVNILIDGRTGVVEFIRP